MAEFPTRPEEVTREWITEALNYSGRRDEQEGIGVFEQLILGPYGPLGLTAMFDGG